MTENIKIYPVKLPEYSLPPEVVNRLVKAGLVYESGGKRHYKLDKEYRDLLEYLAGDLDFPSLDAPSKVLAFENGLFRFVAIVRKDDDLVFCPATVKDGICHVHYEYTSDNLDDMGFGKVPEALAHSRKMGWQVAVVQD